MYELVPFQKNSQAAKIKIFAEAHRNDDYLNILFQLEDKADIVALGPLEDLKKRQDKLWEKTCFEVFFGPVGQTNYWELNVSNQKNWNLYTFDSYRAPHPPQEEKRVTEIQLMRIFEDDTLRLEIALPVARLELSKIEMTFAAVIEFKNKEKSYFALTHLASKADFHKRESFICNLE